MIHQRQRLSFRLESSNNRFRIHAQLDHLERYEAAHGLVLFRHVNRAATSFTKLLE